MRRFTRAEPAWSGAPALDAPPGAPRATVAATAVPVFAVGLQFAPEAVAVPLGTPVEWQALFLGHTVTTVDSATAALLQQGNGAIEFPVDDPDTFDRNLPDGGSFTHTFSEVGAYLYFCRIHPAWGGAIVVA